MSTKQIKHYQRGVDLDTLNDRQQKFVNELLAMDEFNVSEAARRAGYHHPSVRARELLLHPKVRRALGKAQRERQERTNIRADSVLTYLRDALFFNPLTLLQPSKDKEGSWELVDLDALPDEVGRLIESIKIKTTGDEESGYQSTIDVKLIPKQTTLPLAMKHLGLLQENVNHNLDKETIDGLVASLLEQVENRPHNVIDVKAIERKAQR